MGIGSGLGGSVGIGLETVYGTFVAPTRFPEATAAPFQRRPNYAQGGGLAAGRHVRPSGRRVLTHRDAGGTINMEVASTGFGILLNRFFGGTVAPVQQAATTAYLQTHTLGDNLGKSMSIQLGVPSTQGTVNPYTYTGCKFTGLELSCGVGDILTAQWQVDAQDYTEGQALSAPSYTALVPRHFGEMAFKVGTVGAEAAVTGVRKVNLNIARSLKTDMQYANGAGKKAEPVHNDFTEISGTIETDFTTKADFADRQILATPTSIVWEFVGPLIASTYFQTFRVKLPATFISEGTPSLEGPDVVGPTYSFVVDDNLTNQPITVEIISTETTL